MPIGAWGFLAGPLAAAALAAQSDPDAANAAQALDVASDAVEIVAEHLDDVDLGLQGADVFEGALALDEGAMSSASGGEDTAIDISNLGINISDQTGGVGGVNTTNSPTGHISDNIVSDNGGITTVFNNTGNGVLFQSTVNVNIFTAPSSQ